MTSYLRITVRFLQPYSHGRGDGGEPEWPPSPLRLFQALVAAAAARWNERTAVSYAAPALDWLAGLPAPTVVACAGTPADTKYRLYVPDNVGDRVAKAWAGGRSDDIANYRTEKDVRPVRLADGAAAHYLYSLADASLMPHLGTLVAAAQSVTHLGWGVDMVAGDAAVVTAAEADALTGERWRPVGDGSGTALRVPRAGTLAALQRRHAAFLNRLPETGGFVPVPPLAVFDTVAYRRDTDPAPRPWVAFGILKPDASGNASFGTARRCGDVAAWVRHATGTACADWADAGSFVHGHAADGTQAKGDGADERFMYLPLPTVNHALGRVESIRRVLIATPPACRDRITLIRRRLPGHDLVARQEGELESKAVVVGLLNLLPTSDWVLKQYIEPARVWTTVTPVLRPGFDDRDAKKAEGLLRTAFLQAGFPPGLVEKAGLEWRAVGFRAGVEHVRRFDPPKELKEKYPAFHVRVTWPVPVSGPVAVGAGRYRGFGVFVSEPGG
jgi:CRISPR-associated protein Csb2